MGRADVFILIVFAILLLSAVTVTPPHREGSEGGALQPAAGYVTRFMPTCRRPLRPKHIGTTVAGSLSIRQIQDVRLRQAQKKRQTSKSVVQSSHSCTHSVHLAESGALEPVLSQNITQSQMPINNQLITIIIKSKYYRISLAISILGCIFGCRISNTPSHEHQTKHHFCT